MRFPKELWLPVIALVLAAGFLAPPVGAAGQRLVVRVDEPFEVGGQLFASGGVLSLREVSDYSPIATLNEIRVDGRSLGVVIARNDASEDTTTRDELIFERSTRGHLVLASVALKDQPVRRLYPVGGIGDARASAAVTQSQTAMLASTQ